MKRTVISALVFLITRLPDLFGGTGDTTRIQVHQQVHMNWYGSFDQTGAFPSDSLSYGKIIMHYRLGCPASNCSAWDYTTEITALVPTGLYDTVMHTSYLYMVNGNHPDTVYYNNDTTWVTFYNPSLPGTDSTPAFTYLIMVYGDSIDHIHPTDSITAWPGNYYNYQYDSLGSVTDSIYVPALTFLPNVSSNYFLPEERIDHIELGRVITPYGGFYPNTWSHTYDFDVTDYAPILHDSVTIRAFYSGWSDGFTVTLDFDFIEGTPPRNPIRVRNIYNGSFPYGDPNNSIENYLVQKSFSLDSNETMASVNLTPTGHGYDNQECAEFCSKDYQLLVNGSQAVNQAIWRDDCGMNALYHQAGTWIYDRANWCPGDKGIMRSHDISSYITPGGTVDLDVNLQPYTASGGNPVYTMAADLLTFSNPNFSLDATVDDIIAPSNNPGHIRYNPICSHPLVVIKNTGSAPLTSALLTYGLEGSPMNTYTWNGNLDFNRTEQVELPTMNWPSPNSTVFKISISQPNGGTDQYPWNDTLRSIVSFTPRYPDRFVFMLRTNAAPNETSWEVKDDAGTILYQNGTLQANHTYYDTLSFLPGCYTFSLYDSDKDGLSFFANSDGNGYARFMDAYTPNTYIKSFTADFGTSISQQFTVGYTNGIPGPAPETAFFHVFPNPGNGQLTVDMTLPQPGPVALSVYSLFGKKVLEKKVEQFTGQLLHLDLTSEPAGVYLVRVQTAGMQFSGKVVIER